MGATDSGAVFSIEDFQTADPATLAVLQKLIPNLNKLKDEVNGALGGGLSIASNTNSAIKDVDVVTGSRWTSITSFLNSWVAFSAGLQPQWLQLPGGEVVMRGAVKSGTIGTTAFTLPVTTDVDVQVAVPAGAIGNNTLGKIYIPAGTGNVSPYSGTDNSYFSLDAKFLATDPTPFAARITALQFASGVQGVAKGVLPLKCCVKGRPELPVGVDGVSWSDNGQGQILLSDVRGGGLKDATTYTLTLFVVGQ